MEVSENELVICRYSCLPFYKELEYDVYLSGSELINPFKQHRYVADIKNWYCDLEDITPKTWFAPDDIPKNETGSFVLKGETNSKKFLWDSHMFASDRSKVMDVYCRLQDDGLVGSQDIYIRKYVPLFNYATSVHNLPISKEFRFFIAYGKVLTGAFYWSNFAEEIKEQIGNVPSADEVPKEFLQNVIDRVGDNANFYVVDIAQTAEGNWIIIELNDGQMSGLSENDPNILYRELKKVIDNL